MKHIAAALAALSLAGCGTLQPGQTDLVKAVQEIAADPNCGHTDRISGNLGGLTGNNLNVFLERTCPARSQGATQ